MPVPRTSTVSCEGRTSCCFAIVENRTVRLAQFDMLWQYETDWDDDGVEAIGP
jgi:hypothetical protein